MGTVEEARQGYVASLDIPDKYRQRFIEIQENLNSVLGGYPNYIYFAYNRNGTEEDAKPVLDRMTELRPNQKWTISKLIERQSFQEDFLSIKILNLSAKSFFNQNVLSVFL